MRIATVGNTIQTVNSPMYDKTGQTHFSSIPVITAAMPHTAILCDGKTESHDKILALS